MNIPIFPLLILGGGYTGLVIYRQASLLKRQLAVSSREPEEHLIGIPPKQRIFFDLRQEKSWSLLPEAADVIWTFPAIASGRSQAGRESTARTRWPT